MSNINYNLIEEIKKVMPRDLTNITLQLLKEIDSGKKTISQMENIILEEIDELVEE